jgi:hypothetical protein
MGYDDTTEAIGVKISYIRLNATDKVVAQKKLDEYRSPNRNVQTCLK